MDRDKEDPYVRCRFSEIVRFVFYVAVVIFLLSSVVLVAVDYVQMKQRLAAIEEKINADELLRKVCVTGRKQTEIDGRAKVQASLSRRRRALTLSLAGLEKRVKVLEYRAIRNNQSSPFEVFETPGALLRGRDGRDGRDGPAGPPGSPGTPGQPGTPGRDGRKGDFGAQGPPGLKGEAGLGGNVGKQGYPGPKGQKGQEGQGLSGVSYVRWGRTRCEGDGQIVYTGIIGSGAYDHRGGGGNYLCLPNDPKYDKYTNSWETAGAIYGTEYEVISFNPFTNNLHNHDAPCAVCFVRSRGSQLMIPARNDCPSGWAKEYHGYLMTAHYGHQSTRDFICVDWEAEYVPGSQSDKDGALLYLVQGGCGSLPCLPYVSGRELTCAVCTK